MMNFLNEHFGTLCALFILTLLIVSEWKDKASSTLTLPSRHIKFLKSSQAILFWIKVIALLQSLILIVCLLHYFKS